MATRRTFIKTLAAAGSAAVLPDIKFPPKTTPRIAGQQYTWATYFQRDGKNWFSDLNISMKALLDSGMNGYEPSFDNIGQVEPLKAALSANQVWANSMYVNSLLHDSGKSDESIKAALDIANAARPIGIQVVVTNPSPIQWGGNKNKSDEQLRHQAAELNKLGAALRQIGMKLAFHNHDPELRAGAREFHHMMLNTDPENVHLCFEPHWIFRGSENSEAAVFDILKLYGERIIEMHIRQSQDGIWTEVFGPGEIDYVKLASELMSREIYPLLVLEQAPEKGTPTTMDAIEANKRSLEYVYKVFGDFP